MWPDGRRVRRPLGISRSRAGGPWLEESWRGILRMVELGCPCQDLGILLHAFAIGIEDEMKQLPSRRGGWETEGM